MRVKKSISKNTINYSIIKDVTIGNKRSTTTVENLGNHETLLKKYPGIEPIEWAKQRAEELNRLEKEGNEDILIKLSQTRKLDMHKNTEFHGGYLFLQNLYYNLGLNKISKEIEQKHKFTFSLDDILSRLIYGRILSPSSKRSTIEFSKKLLEYKDIELHHFYRALEIISQEFDFIQEQLYKNSQKLVSRNTDVLYYDCTNFYFEIEEDDEFRKYGVSKENRPNPIVEMGLFMDADGIPLAFSLHSGSTNEQTTLKPLERKIVKDFKASEFIVCTDAGLSSRANKLYNSMSGRGYVTTQSIKKLPKEFKQWALARDNWRIVGGNSNRFYNISEIEDNEDYKDKIFYKECSFKEENLPFQNLIVTYSIEYRNYHRKIRERHIERAMKLIKTPSKLNSKRTTDYKRLVKVTSITVNGEIAEKKYISLDEEKIFQESLYDGIYGVSTNLDEPIEKIIEINKRRWQIEECFKIMKSEFKSRPVYLSREDRIKAHFMICFLSLTLFRFLEQKLDANISYVELIKTLRDYKFKRFYGLGYTPIYTRTEITDLLHTAFGFNTDFEIISEKNFKKIFKETKK